MEKTLIRIAIISDVVCPWCYIGKRRLEKAISLTSDQFEFEREYLPFELNPHMSEEGADYREYFIKKFGSEEKFQQVTDHTKKVAGILFQPFQSVLFRYCFAITDRPCHHLTRHPRQS